MARPKKEKPVEIPFEGNLEDVIIQSLLEKKGVDIMHIDLKKINHVFFDSFIICSGTSKTHVETLSEYVQENVKKTTKIRPSFVEGKGNGEWILVDYFNIIVHIFQEEIRTYYDIEKLWSDAPVKQF
ncbi:MAG: ribosome silencing factor [Bacteroidetes bacterium HGW-Bacteroidetes-20]|nr:MAG: ribosome silencing factor [Bacteroidetes bacterium HGW-Bacteroidetes-20]